MALWEFESTSHPKLGEALGGCRCLIKQTILPEATEINYGFHLDSSLPGFLRQLSSKEDPSQPSIFSIPGWSQILS